MSEPSHIPVFDVESAAQPVFVVDDDRQVREGMARALTRAGYDVMAFGSGEEALDAITESVPKLIVTDRTMPGMTGLEMAERALGVRPDLRVILVTGAGGEAVAQAALRLGAVDYLTKPIEMKELIQSVHRGLVGHAVNEYGREMNRWLHEEVRAKSSEVESLTIGALASLVRALEARSPHFKGHSQNVADLAMSLATTIGLSDAEVQAVRSAALLHDVGMIAVPDAVIEKPADLTDEERLSIREHCGRGADILEPLSHLGSSIRFVLEHHERLNGSGYPGGKRGEEISIGGQVVGLAEAWAGLTEERAFRDAMSKEDAMETLVGAAGQWFSSELIRALGGVVA